MGEVRGMEKLPEGWRRVRFQDVVYFQEGPGLMSYQFKEVGIPFLNIRCITEKGIDETKLQYLEEKEAVIKYKQFFLDENDLVVSSSGTLGRSLFIKKEDLPLLLNTSIIRMRPYNVITLDRKYLKCFVESHFFQKEIYRLSTGSAQNNYGPSHLKTIYIIFPEHIKEQHKIAEILETVDNAIEKTDKLIEKYKRIKQGLMQDLLTKGIDENGQIRSEKTHKFKDSLLGRIPEEWEVVRLGEVGDIISGSTPDTAKKEFWNGNITWITPDDLSKLKNKYIFTSHRKISQKGLKSCSAKTIPENSIVISTRAPIGYIAISKTKYTTNQGCKSIKLNDYCDYEFIYYCLHMYVNKMITLGSGTTFGEISKVELSRLDIAIPQSRLEQHRIASILSQIDGTIEKETQYKEKLQRLKSGLMEDLLTGKVRVNHLIEEGDENV